MTRTASTSTTHDTGGSSGSTALQAAGATTTGTSTMTTTTLDIKFTSLDEAVAAVEARFSRNQEALRRLRAIETVKQWCIPVTASIVEGGRTTWEPNTDAAFATIIPIAEWLTSRVPNAEPQLLPVSKVCAAGPLSSFADVERLGPALMARMRAAAEVLQDTQAGMLAGFCDMVAAALQNLDVLHAYVLRCMHEAQILNGDRAADVAAFYECQSARIEGERVVQLPGVRIIDGRMNMQALSGCVIDAGDSSATTVDGSASDATIAILRTDITRLQADVASLTADKQALEDQLHKQRLQSEAAAQQAASEVQSIAKVLASVQQQAAAEREQLMGRIDALAADKRSTLERSTELESALGAAHTAKERADTLIAELQASLTASQAQVAELTAALDAARPAPATGPAAMPAMTGGGGAAAASTSESAASTTPSTPSLPAFDAAAACAALKDKSFSQLLALVAEKRTQLLEAQKSLIALGTVVSRKYYVQPQPTPTGSASFIVLPSATETPINEWLASTKPPTEPTLLAVDKACAAGPLSSYGDVDKVAGGISERCTTVAGFLQEGGSDVTETLRGIVAATRYNLDVLRAHVLRYEVEAAVISVDKTEELRAFYGRQSTRIDEEKAASFGAVTIVEGKLALSGSITFAEAAWLTSEITRVSGAAPADMLSLKPAFQGSKDGFTGAAFARVMSGKGRTLALIHVNHNGVLCVFGGFTTAGFKDGGYHHDEHAFLFTLRNPHGIPPTAYAITSPQHATHCSSSSGSMFAFGGGHDIKLTNDCNTKTGSYTNFPHSYADTTAKGKATFSGAENGWLVTDVWAFTVWAGPLYTTMTPTAG